MASRDQVMKSLTNLLKQRGVSMGERELFEMIDKEKITKDFRTSRQVFNDGVRTGSETVTLRFTVEMERDGDPK